ncbi:LysR substrate-binding domain-containing protein [Halomonas urumqiensis]|uniref:LysR family transcriptional regulator n=1 Tax=Halomonas urumqiensis TaxID=1684789 RepID=A0A2N7UMK6_9GAMM|nr:LysR substrate-binding domain-containing protein [Halomonas urumqiensis]PMR81658.1 LysR family transcriptional regulator [Halomonas urumqiensis]PTB02295.1 LysR family transcriptional regulator [Halomonas urumqiensis]GHE21763.1 LysR family transcriptional regulator [Halomonas urumqiensis]
MQDLNDLYYFVQVVDHGGFAPAGRALGIPKSKLSRRIGQLEERLGTRLIHRSTRHLSVTELGQAYYRHCQAMLVEAQAAEELIARNLTLPRGTVRLSCPPSLLHYLITPLLVRFMAQCPDVEVQVEATSRRIDVVKEGFDMAIRVRFPPLEDSDLAMKVLARSPQRLVAAPALLEERPRPRVPGDLATLPSLDFEQVHRQHYWELDGPEGETAQIRHQPRLVTDNAETLHRAALAGLGVVKLALLVASQDLQAGRLIDVVPGWEPRGGILHAVFPTRRGVLPAVRALLEFLADNINEVDFTSDTAWTMTQSGQET